MAKNLANLGIAWYSDDKKVQNDIGVLQKSLDGIKDTLTSIKRTNAINAIVDAVSMDKLRKIKDGVSELTSGNLEAAGAAGPLDSMYAQAAKSASQLAASSSKVAENMQGVRKSVGIARSLNIDAQSVQNIAAEFARLETNATKYGFKSMSEFVKMTQVAEVQGENLVRTLKGLETGFGFSGKGAGKLLDEVTHIGQEFGFGTHAVQQFEQVTGTLNEHLRYMGEDAGPEEFSEMTRQVYLLAGGMTKLGKEPSEAMSAATQVFTNLAQSQGEMRGMFTGKGGLPDLLQQGAISMGDFNKMQNMMSEKPLDFIMQMGEHFESLGERQQEFLRQRVFKDMEADIDWFIQGNWKQSVGDIENLRKNMDKASGSAGKMANHFRTGRTYTERLNLVTEDYQQSLSDLTKNALGKTFIKRQRNFYMGMLAPAFKSMSKGTFMIEEGVGAINSKLESAGINARVTKKQLGGLQEVFVKGFLGLKASGFEGMMVAAMDAEPAIRAISYYAGVTTDAVREANEDGYVAQFTLLWKAAKGYSGELKENFFEFWKDLKSVHPVLGAVDEFFKSISERVKMIGDFWQKNFTSSTAIERRISSLGQAGPDGRKAFTKSELKEREKLRSILASRGDGFDEDLKDKFKKLGAGAGGLAAALPLLKGLGGVGGAGSLVSAVPGGGLLLAALGLAGGVVAIEKEAEGGIEGFLERMAAKVGPLIEKSKPYIKEAADALGKFFSKLVSLIDWNKVGKMIASGVGGFVSAITSGLKYAFGGSEGRRELEKAATGGKVQSSMALAMGKAFEGLGEALKGMGKGILTSIWEGIVGKEGEDKGFLAKAKDAGKTVAGMFVTGILVGVAGTLTRSRFLKAIGGILRAPIAVPFKFVAGTTKAATKGYLVAKAMTKAGELASKYGFADDVAAAESRVAAASTSKEARAAKGALRRAQMGEKLRGAGSKVVGGVDKVVAKSGILGKVLGLEARFERFKTGGQFLQSLGGAAPEAAKSMTFMKSMKNALGQTRIVQFFKFLGKAGKAIGKALAPVAKFASKIVTPIIMIWEYMKRLPDIVADFGSLFSDALDPDELTKKGWAIAKNFLGILDAFFLNIPSWIGKKLGITTELVESFYQFLGLKTYETIEYVAAFFGSMGDRIEGIYYGVKATAIETFMNTGAKAVSFVSGMVTSFFSLADSAVDVWHDIAKVGAVKFAEMLGHGNSFANELKLIFGSVSNVIIFDIIEPISRTFSEVFGGILDLIMKLPGADKALSMLGFESVDEFKDATDLHARNFGKNATPEKLEKMRKKRLSDIGVKTKEELEKENEQLKENARRLTEKSRQASHANIDAARKASSKGLNRVSAGLSSMNSSAKSATRKSLEADQRVAARFAEAEQRNNRERERSQAQTLGTLKGPGTARPKRPEPIRPGQGPSPTESAINKQAKTAEEQLKISKAMLEEQRKSNKNKRPPRVTGPEIP